MIKIHKTESRGGATAEQLGKRFCWWNKGEVYSEAVFEQGVIIERITSMSHPPFPLPSPSSNSFSLVCSHFVVNGTFLPPFRQLHSYHFIKRASLQNDYFSQSQLLYLSRLNEQFLLFFFKKIFSQFLCGKSVFQKQCATASETLSSWCSTASQS